MKLFAPKRLVFWLLSVSPWIITAMWLSDHWHPFMWQQLAAIILSGVCMWAFTFVDKREA